MNHYGLINEQMVNRAHAGDPASLATLLHKGGTPWALDQNGMSALYYAIDRGNAACVAQMAPYLDLSRIPGQLDPYSDAPLPIAVRRRHTACVDRLIPAYLDQLAELPDEHMEAAILSLAIGGYTEYLDTVLSQQPAPDDRLVHLLTVAMAPSRAPQNGYSVPSRERRTPLYVADIHEPDDRLITSRYPCLEVLVAHIDEADLNTADKTPGQIAISLRDPRALENVLPIEDPQPLLWQAIEEYRIHEEGERELSEISRLLVEVGADPLKLSGPTLATMHQSALESACRENMAEIVRAHLECGVDLTDPRVGSALRTAVTAASPDCLDVFADHGITFDDVNSWNHDPMEIAGYDHVGDPVKVTETKERIQRLREMRSNLDRSDDRDMPTSPGLGAKF